MQENETLWNQIKEQPSEDMSKIMIKQDCEDLFTLDICFKKRFDM